MNAEEEFLDLFFPENVFEPPRTYKKREREERKCMTLGCAGAFYARDMCKLCYERQAQKTRQMRKPNKQSTHRIPQPYPTSLPPPPQPKPRKIVVESESLIVGMMISSIKAKMLVKVAAEALHALEAKLVFVEGLEPDLAEMTAAAETACAAAFDAVRQVNTSIL